MTTEATTKATEKAIVLVKFADGRELEFSGKKRLHKTSRINEQTGKLEVLLDFVNGESRLFTLPDAMVNQFALHGAEQKLGDEMAGVANIEDAILEVDNLIDRLYEGKWNQGKTAGASAGSSILHKAMVEVSGKPADILRRWLAGKSQAEKMALRNSPSLKPTIERLEAERAAKRAEKGGGINTDDLLNDLANFDGTVVEGSAGEGETTAEGGEATDTGDSTAASKRRKAKDTPAE